MVGKASLIVVMGFGSILGYIALNLNRSATNAVGNMSTYYEATASHNIALAGANVGLAKFYTDTTWFGTISQNLSSTMGGSFTVTNTDIGGNKVRLRSISTYVIPPPNAETLRDTVEVYFDKTRYNSFSMFAWMTQFEGNVFWITGDTVWGRIHSNGNLHVNGRPTFYEKVTTSKAFNPKPGTGTNKAIFKKGYETGVAPIDFPDDLTAVIDASTSGGVRYTERIFVDLVPGTSANNDGIAVIRRTPSDPSPDTIALSNPAFNGVILSTDTVRVKGTLDGRLTIASLRDLYIDDNVRYEQNPRTIPNSDDLLGLVAEKNIIVATNPANNTHCEIDACVFSRDGSFVAEKYNTRPVSGELRFYGSIVQDTRGPVGTFSGSNIISGFSKRYRYDDRLSNPAFRPPYYPGFYVKTYAITNWWESFRVPEIR
ncbi:hypothetical protein FBQ87_13320 [Sphingobacteriales bacterium CHB3]|nr:hypothetical protein [Sphingobacteriales bacterium CHB3]